MKISNQYLIATFKTKGAELASLKKGTQEYIWQADPVHWGRHAPVLFPIVGKLKENSYELDKKTYEMGQHGFARDQEFLVISHGSDSIVFSLTESRDTLKIYPFRFELIISYQLKGASLEVSYEVKNTDEKTLIFSIGAHPAFNCPMNAGEQRSDYFLSFDREEDFVTHRLAEGNYTGETEVIAKGKDLQVSDNLFDKDALVFKKLNSRKVSLQNTGRKWLTFHFDGFPYLGIWSKNAESPFVCIEPWYGLADYKNHNKRLTEKEGIQQLPKGKTFSCTYLVEIH